jgi:hypothetical protein
MKMTKDAITELTLQVPTTFQTPAEYLASTPEQNAQMLLLGSQAFSYMKQEGQKVNHETLFQQLKTQAESEYMVKIRKLEDSLTATRTTLEREEQTYKELLADVKRRLVQEQSQTQETERRIREEERRNREELLCEKEKQILVLREQLESGMKSVEQQVKESHRSFSESLCSFKEQFLKTTTGSKKKGDQGEAVFCELLKRAFGSEGSGDEFEVNNVGKEGYQGDLRMRWRDHNLMWEIKNYDRNVDKKEVQKFIRDMEESKDISMGIMVSMNTGIAGHTKAGDIDIEVLADGRICVYLCNFFSVAQEPILYLQSLKPFFQTFLSYKETQKMGSGDDETLSKRLLDRFEHHRGIMLKLLKKHEESTRKFKNTIAHSKKQMDQTWQTISVEMREAENSVKLLLETMMEIPTAETIQEEEEEVKEEQQELPEYVFRHTDLAMYTSKERKFVEQMLGLLEFGDELSILKKDLKELFKPYKYSDETISRFFEQVLMEDAWNKGGQKVRFMRMKV